MAKEERFDRGEAIRFGWEITKNNLLFFVLILLITWSVSAIFSVPNMLGGRYIVIFPFFGLIQLVIGVFVGMAYVRISLRFLNGETAEFSDLWASYPFFFNYLVGNILYALIVLGGLILLIVPGIIWGLKYQFYGFFILDQGMGPVAAIKKSGEITNGSKGNLFVLGLEFFGIILLGALACVVGLFAAIPTVIIARAFVYRKLASQAPPQVLAAPSVPPSTTPMPPGT
ncbi:MAG: hypothetical protein A2Y75_11840 [Candidatus Solincola sediminis]|uniref:DUF975 family protein n=1 Tax=Candidatus Solincola sediminis TaxID=1797199 RepID=A0A1F2WM69_9ACTN|nr:MAG: hypothetical protein A2Y75_11840 [Candidatus Solincola sediminis]